MAYQIKHLRLGGILDQAISITKDHFGLLFRIMLCGLIPLQLVTGFLQIAGSPELPSDATFEDVMAAQTEAQPYAFLGNMLALLGTLTIYPLTNAAVTDSVARLYLGQETSAVASFKYALKRFLPLIGTTILMVLAIWGGLILLIVPGILFMLWFGLAQQVVIIEGLAGTKALGRSKKLVRPHLGTYLILYLILLVISLSIYFGAFFIAQPHVRLLTTTLLSVATTILWTTAWVVFYFSCRCAVENFDLEYLAESIESEQPEADAGAAGAAI